MRSSVLGLVALAAAIVPLSGCAHDPRMPATDLLVMGRVETLGYQPLDDLGMNGQFTARLTISRVLGGRAPSSPITIRYIARTDFAADRDFRFHLRRSEDGTWLACSDGKGGKGYDCR